jgi:hypothetical protein
MLGIAVDEVELMSSVAQENILWVPVTKEEMDLVRMQMHRLLATSHFRNSRRYPALFKFIVEETLEGRGEFLKERLLGVHVFDRPADYDTATDPIVRVTIAEIRKRIAQYYHEEAHQSEMRIELMPGHYAPQFRPRQDIKALSDETRTPSEAQLPSGSGFKRPSDQVIVVKTALRKFMQAWRYGLAACVLLAAVGFGIAWRAQYTSGLNQFWQPILASHKTVLFCLPTANSTIHGATPFNQDGSLKDIFPYNNAAAADNKSFLEHETLGENLVFSDVLATVGISSLFATQNRDSRYKLSTVLSLDDLRQGPAVLIGGFDNQWSLRAINNLRYRFFANNYKAFSIIDTKNPQDKRWTVQLDTPLNAVHHDYALIARIHDDDTGQVEVIVAGIGMSGTAAAGELLVNPRELDELRRKVGAGFRDHDFEAVLSTDVVSGSAGTAKIEAVWVR